MRLAYKMEMALPVDNKSTVDMTPFSCEYREEYKIIYNDCFREMRMALEIEPYDFIQDDSFFDDGMEEVYLLLDDGSIVGSVALKGNEIDDLIVASRYQGQGYGKEILLWALEHIHSDRAFIHVAEWNKKAVSLYKKTGFEIVETIEF